MTKFGHDLTPTQRATPGHWRRGPGELLAIPAAAVWAEILQGGDVHGVYTFQLPFAQATAGSSVTGGEEVVVFSSYSYLGLATHPRVLAAATDALQRYGSSSGGVRMMTGTLELHLELERALAEFVGQPSAISFSSGYVANLGCINALFGPGDAVILDQFAHASLVAGARLSGASVHHFAHNDLDALEDELLAVRRAGVQRVLIAVDGVFSMDGDQAPLAELIALKQRHGAFLLVDEAHAVGVLGQTGRGTWEAQGVDPGGIDLLTGALSKGIPSTGGFVAGAADLCRFLQHGVGPYVFSAALSPANAAAALEGLRVLADEPEHLETLWVNVARLRHGLVQRGLTTGDSSSPVIPLLLGDELRALRWARWLLDEGVCASAVQWPAVPRGAARLRLCATAAHRPAHFERLFAALDLCQTKDPG